MSGIKATSSCRIPEHRVLREQSATAGVTRHHLQKSTLVICALRPEILPWPGGEAVHVSPLVFSSCTSGLPSLLGSSHEHCKVAEDFEISHGVSFAAN